MVLLDIKKAYDRTPRALIYRKLKNRGVPDQRGSEDRSHHRDAGTCRSHAAGNCAGAGSGYPVVRRQYRHDPDRDAWRPPGHHRCNDIVHGSEAGPQSRSEEGR